MSFSDRFDWHILLYAIFHLGYFIDLYSISYTILSIFHILFDLLHSHRQLAGSTIDVELTGPQSNVSLSDRFDWHILLYEITFIPSTADEGGNQGKILLHEFTRG